MRTSPLPLLSALLAVLASVPAYSQGQAAPAIAPTGPMRWSRNSHTAVALPSGEVVVIGGANARMQVRDIEIYDPATHAFHIAGQMKIPRQGHSSYLLPDGRILSVGGYAQGLNSLGQTQTEIFDPVTGASVLGAKTEILFYEPRFIPLSTGKILISNSYTADNALYDPKTGTLLPTAPQLFARHNQCAALLPNGKVLIAGGDSPESTSSAELYDPATETTTPTQGPLAQPTTDSCLSTTLPDGQVLFFTSRLREDDGVLVSEIQQYDASTDTFKLVGTLSTPRSLPTVTALLDGRVLIAGGLNFSPGTSPTLSSAEIFDPASGAATPLDTPMSGGRANFASALLPTGEVLLIGGSNMPAGDRGSDLSSVDLFTPSRNN